MRGAQSSDCIKLVLDGGCVLFNRHRARIAPFDQEAAAASLEQATGIADVHVKLFRRTILAGFLVDLESLLPGFIVDDGLHGCAVEVEALGCALGLHISRSNRLNGEIGLGIALLEDARAVVSHAVAVHVLAMDGGCNCEIVVPGLGRRLSVGFENVLAVIDHLEVAIDHQQLGLAADFLAEFAEIGCDVSHVDLGVLGHIGVKVSEQPSGVEFHAPTGGEHAHVNRVGSGGPVRLDLLEDFGERHFADDYLGARCSFKFLATLCQTAGDDRTWARQDVDGDAIIFAGGRGGCKSANGGSGHQSTNDYLT